MFKRKSMPFFIVLLSFAIILGGCGLLKGGNQEIDPPQSESIIEDESALEESGVETEDKDVSDSKETADQSVMTELYLIDKNGYVVPQTIALPSQQGVAKQALEHLVADGPVTDLLPNGFRAVLPAGTQVDVDIKDGKATVDFSKEFANYNSEDELKILQAVTWTLTQFDSVETVKLQMNGHELKEMPVNKTPISENLTRANGINIDTSSTVDITNSTAMTLYYLGGDDSNYYYVPVTKRVDVKGNDMVSAVVKELVKGPGSSSKLLTEFMPDVALLTEPKIDKKEAKISLNFNENIYGSFDENIVSQSLIDVLVLSLTEQKGIESVEVLVNGKASLVTEDGKELSAPVNRPEKVNRSSL
ncbi:GerMN domain-containing protein [Bacillus sp. AGMB 02131]|uniref:GerMN domain-containing protein n=1 Tax=Peribacillus faecalis TaxID=2772559 RepID=A0A927CV53_9BACI|nr:GerMN domain-containing protein [Peribacillus faecalis]MBD3108392.1 GerMN domain-containing protein [Peribacillus faecalis]